MMRQYMAILCIMLGLCVASTQAFYNAEPNYPAEIKIYIGNKPPLGSGTVSTLFENLYDVAIWTKGKSWNWSTPFALRLTYAKNFTSEEIVNASIDEIGKLHKLDEETAVQYRKIFASIFPAVKQGDSISAIYLPGKALIFFYNSHRIGTIQDMNLARDFLDIWLSDHARDPELRKSILNT